MNEIGTEEGWMARCLQLADRAKQAGECAVGCVIVREGAVLAEAFEQVLVSHDAAGHAEILAVRRACEGIGSLNLSGCTLYTNVEPCWMCSFAIRETGISEVVIGTSIADIGGVTSRFPILSEPNVPGWGYPPALRWIASKSGLR